MDSTDLKDKIALDPSDSTEMVEFFSRKEPGDKITGRFEATLDDNGQKVIVLSIDEISIDAAEGEEITAKSKRKKRKEGESDDEGAEGEGAEKPTSVDVTKSEDGVSDGEGSEPPETQPSR